DGSQSLPFKPDSFDRILVDAPCSGTGTLRHNPEIRWRLSEDDIPRLAAQQGLLLQNVVGVLKPGGRLIYSTCSIEREENEAVVEGVPVLKTHIWMPSAGRDGFFAAVITS